MRPTQIIRGCLTALLVLSVQSCDLFSDMDIDNFNSPDINQVYENVQDYPALLSGAYNSWWNHCIGVSPVFALIPAAEIMTTGYGSWGSSPYYKIPRELVPNTDADPVLLPPAACWYGFYQAIPTVNIMISKLTVEGKRVIIGEKDYTNACLAHAYILQGLLYGHLAMIYDKAFLIKEDIDTDNFTYGFSDYKLLMAFALSKIDKGIELCQENFTDPIEMLPEVKFNNVTLAEFANSMAARMMIFNARNEQETIMIDWERVLSYAQKGMKDDFKVNVKDGWSGMVINSDPWSYLTINDWGWIRVHQRIINMMAPDDQNAIYPWPYGRSVMGPVNSPDSRFDNYFTYEEKISWAKYAPSTGYQIMSHYRFTRFNALFNYGVGYINFYSAEESRLIIAEAILRTGGSKSEVAELINQSRVNKGMLEPALETETRLELTEKIIYERLVETMMTYPLAPFFDRRRTDIRTMGLYPGTVRHLPVPYKELLLHGLEPYSFGGINNEM